MWRRWGASYGCKVARVRSVSFGILTSRNEAMRSDLKCGAGGRLLWMQGYPGPERSEGILQPAKFSSWCPYQGFHPHTTGTPGWNRTNNYPLGRDCYNPFNYGGLFYLQSSSIIA